MKQQEITKLSVEDVKSRIADFSESVDENETDTWSSSDGKSDPNPYGKKDGGSIEN